MSSFWRNPLKWIINQFPPDPSNRAGVGPFRPPEWMDRAAELHDISFIQSKDSGERLSEVDWSLFWRWTFIASKEPDPMKRCRMAHDICKYWPYARRFGRYFWDGK